MCSGMSNQEICVLDVLLDFCSGSFERHALGGAKLEAIPVVRDMIFVYIAVKFTQKLCKDLTLQWLGRVLIITLIQHYAVYCHFQ